jgi:hypothetical protein
MQLMIAWLIKRSQVDSCVGTWKIRDMSRRCFTSYRLVWDFPFDTRRLGVVDALPVCDHIDFSGMPDFRVGLVDLTEIHWQDMIHDSGNNSLRPYRLWMQEWMIQSRQEDHVFRVRVAQCQHDRSFLVMAWDPGILRIDSLEAGTDGRTSCYLQEAPRVSTL